MVPVETDLSCGGCPVEIDLLVGVVPAEVHHLERLVPVEIGLLVRLSVETDLLVEAVLLRLTTFWRWFLIPPRKGRRTRL